MPMKSLLLAGLVVIAASLVHGQSSKKSHELPSHVCYLGADSGPCKAYFSKWYYNRQTWMCEEFIYGGCGGNANRFDTKEECEDVCDVDVDICFLKPVTGPCEALIPRWFFNPAKGECEQFTYGGCGGNANNFETFNECQEECGGGEEPRHCQIEGEKCKKQPDAVYEDGFEHPLLCCDGLTCCACGPPVETEGYDPPESGTCQSFCTCPRG